MVGKDVPLSSLAESLLAFVSLICRGIGGLGVTSVGSQ